MGQQSVGAPLPPSVEDVTPPYDVANEQPRIDDSCFRLLSLQSETQCELEVVKPVIEELEVLRLSCTLGMLTTVNKKDFQYEQVITMTISLGS